MAQHRLGMLKYCGALFFSLMREDFYKTIIGHAESDYREKGSKFFAFAHPCADETALKQLLDYYKKLHPTARHFCYAWVYNAEQPQHKHSDAGEPAGTAGLPILNQLLSAQLTDVAVIVVRYFGGSLLGKPGLIHAYKQSAADAIAKANVTEKMISTRVVFSFGYEHSKLMLGTIERFESASITEQEFNERCRIVVQFPKSTLSKALHLFDHQPAIETQFHS